MRSKSQIIKLIRNQRIRDMNRVAFLRKKVRRVRSYTPSIELPSTAWNLARRRVLYIDKNEVKVDWMKEGF